MGTGHRKGVQILFTTHSASEDGPGLTQVFQAPKLPPGHAYRVAGA